MDFEGILTMPLWFELSWVRITITQAGAGIVAGSDEESEMEEVYNNKLRALNKALDLAETI
jgi:anthranilate synthase component 1